MKEAPGGRVAEKMLTAMTDVFVMMAVMNVVMNVATTVKSDLLPAVRKKVRRRPLVFIEHLYIEVLNKMFLNVATRGRHFTNKHFTAVF